MTNVRVRFAPSPTGTLHIGSARAALYNWLYARHFGAEGTYVLRIEDTDTERSTPEMVDLALRVFDWLGLDWDEGPRVEGPHGPYFQSERADKYAAAADTLHARGHAYECFCTKAELDAEREAAMADKRAPIYSGRCRNLSDAEREALRAEGRPASLRFRVPAGGEAVVVDLVHGEKRFDNDLLGDFIIVRSDGSAVYNFANVVDDADMRITHVIRGDDHLSNTPRQVLLYEALGHDVPLFAHAPMINGPDGKKLSKRHGAASVEDLAEAGYVPAAVRNYLALLGWSKDDTTTVMSTDELIEHFDVARMRKSPATFDYDKFRWMNGVYLREHMTGAEFAAAYAEWRDRWLEEGDELFAAAHAATPEQVAYLAKDKVDTLRDVPALVEFLAEPHEMADAAWEKLAAVEQAPQVLEAVVTGLESLPDFTSEAVEQLLRGLCTELELKPKFVFSPVRFAVTGRTITPGLWESIVTLGRERSVERLRAALQRLQVTA